MISAQRVANSKFAAQVRAQQAHAERGRAEQAKANEEHVQRVRAVQRRTRIAAVEQKLAAVKGYLRYSPQDPALIEEEALLSEMYADLLSEQPSSPSRGTRLCALGFRADGATPECPVPGTRPRRPRSCGS